MRSMEMDRLGVPDNAAARHENKRIGGVENTAMSGIALSQDKKEALKDELAVAKIKQVADRINKFAISKFSSLRDMYQRLDEDNDGTVTKVRNDGEGGRGVSLEQSD